VNKQTTRDEQMVTTDRKKRPERCMSTVFTSQGSAVRIGHRPPIKSKTYSWKIQGTDVATYLALEQRIAKANVLRTKRALLRMNERATALCHKHIAELEARIKELTISPDEEYALWRAQRCAKETP
jgi:hypothetical protein